MNTEHLVIFTIEKQRFAVRYTEVKRVVRAVEITPLPSAPEIIVGVINVQGEVLPVINLRKRLCLKEKEIDIDDKLIVLNTHKRTVIIIADAIEGVIKGEDIICAKDIVKNIDTIQGILKINGDLTFICDIEKFLSIEEEEALERAEHSIK
ncbi:MAG: purine-binding chemotaxis protein CheW [Candidatus Kuenenia sp.]|nr:purine-binding chemotaxis protein CheW [Candidatus Kuenenia hertensis]